MIYIVRGLPGSGKSTLARTLVGEDNVLEADQYFVSPETGRYNFRPDMLAEAHADCYRRVVAATAHWQSKADGAGGVAVANTFTCRWEFQPYLELAMSLYLTYTVIDLFDAGLSDDRLATVNRHGVPARTIHAMRSRWEHAWGDAPTTRPVR